MIDPQALGLPIIRQSPDDLVVVKPAGMATELTSDPRRTALISRVRKAAPEGVSPRLVHRLDRVTRGIVMVALSHAAAAFYADQIREGLWEKYYIARISRPPRTKAQGPAPRTLVGEHKAYIKEDKNRARLVRVGGKVSLLQVLAVEPAPDFPGHEHALIRLLTGRLHQIRVMLAGLGAPLVGDDVYGGAPGSFYLEHAALWYVDYTTREITLAHRPDDPERERLAAPLHRELGAVLRPGH